jgi:steroid delta-isomerase-like uncharacterized protein
MSAQALATRFAAAFNSGDPENLALLYAPDAVAYHPFFPEGMRGREAILRSERGLFEAFSDITATVHTVIEDGRKVALEWEVQATHTGELPLPDGGVVAPTGKRISQPGVEVFYLDEDGLIAEGHRYQDGAGFMAQLGLG